MPIEKKEPSTWEILALLWENRGLVMALLRNKEEGKALWKNIQEFTQKILDESGNGVTDPEEAEKIAVATVGKPGVTAANARDFWMTARETDHTP